MENVSDDKILENFTYLIGSTIKFNIEGIEKISYSPELPYADTIHVDTKFGKFKITIKYDEKD